MKNLFRYIVVDDDKTNNLICEFVIKGWRPGAEVELFEKPEEALKKFGENKGGFESPILLFLDVNMPTMSGWEFLDIFNTFDESIKSRFRIYILTSSIEKFDKETILYPCVSGFLSKPLEKHDLDRVWQELEKTGLNGKKIIQDI